MQRIFFIGVIFLLTGCIQMYNRKEDDLSTVPVTNNPTIIPNYHSSFPGGGIPY